MRTLEIIVINNGKGKAQVNDSAWPCSSLQNFESCAQIWEISVTRPNVTEPAEY